MESREPELRVTTDGSHSLYHPVTDQLYHSHHGAVQESMHVFIKHGYECVAGSKDHIRILEIGFGTGLNALLTQRMADDKTIYYESLEYYPISANLAEQLNYPRDNNERTFFHALHNASWNTVEMLSPQFQVHKRLLKIQDYVALDASFDVIYFDAFSPSAQPELWREKIFCAMYNSLNYNGVLVTYCSKGDVRRAMIAAGFSVEKLPGPPGKREMLRGIRMK
jgi:tRNA U34 5-methylaminomethyl-2-thiouridine-forming methyltransferase MnmC